MIKAVIFDLDGVLVDSEPLSAESVRRVLKKFGVEYDGGDKQLTVGRGERANFRFFKRKFKIEAGLGQLLEEREKTYRAVIQRRGVKVMKGALGLINELERRRLKVAVATSGSLARLKLRKSGLDKFFNIVVTAEDVKRTKPAPDLFLEAARRLGARPDQCLVFEDSRAGLLAAKAAGMKCVVVPGPYNRGDDFSQADLVVGSLSSFSLSPFGPPL